MSPACRWSMVAKPPVVARKGQRCVLFRWLCWSCSACLRVFVVVVWLVFVGGLGGIATIGAALRRVVGVSGVYGRKTPRVVAWMGQGRVPVEGSMVVNLPGGCSKCSRPRWNGGDMGFLGCSGRRFGRAGSWRGVFCGAACRVRRASVRAAGMIEPTVGVFCGAAREGGASWCVLVTYSCAVAWEVLPRMVRFFCGGIGWVSCARVLVGTIDRTVGAGVPMQPFPTAESIHVGAYTSGGASWQPRSCGVVLS